METVLPTISDPKRKGMGWMNPKAIGPAAYVPTDVEHWANMVTHGVFVLPTAYCATLMVGASRSDTQQAASIVYGIGLTGLFAVSTFFHIVFYLGYFKNLKEVLHRGDRAMIYIFIASSYTPWLILRPLPPDCWTVNLKWGVWVLAVIGIIYQQIFHERYKLLETCLYLTIGILPSLAVIDMEDHTGLDELKLGGGIYILGVIFFKVDGRIPMAHAIWHLFVVLGAFIHYYAVMTYLILPQHPDGGKLDPASMMLSLTQGSFDPQTCDKNVPDCAP
ncbi:unnamed protein product, partial [Meganyctiphanes norvegica]